MAQVLPLSWLRKPKVWSALGRVVSLELSALPCWGGLRLASAACDSMDVANAVGAPPLSSPSSPLQQNVAHYKHLHFLSRCLFLATGTCWHMHKTSWKCPRELISLKTALKQQALKQEGVDE